MADIDVLVTQDQLRAEFASALSDMYQRDVPQYGTLLDLVSAINQDRSKQLGNPLEDRTEVERHGAIRLGTAEELATIRRFFSLMGMQPVGYYDLTVAGLPVHATCFRPLARTSLARNPFRVFTSLLRMDLIQDAPLRARALEILRKRRIFTPRCVELIGELEASRSFPRGKAEELLREALETFRWHKTSTVDLATYQALHVAHPLIADVVCFRGPHINHLTPRVLDIEAAQVEMQRRGLQAKEEIEGLPPRRCAILLRQTSFLALEEEIAFSGGTEKGGKHKARFGEIERGAALKPKGRVLYDQLIDRSRQPAAAGRTKQEVLAKCFGEFPDEREILRREGLAYFTYSIRDDRLENVDLSSVDALVDAGVLTVEPITYEDFLPVSAAGIFQSNLGPSGVATHHAEADQGSFENALGVSVKEVFSIYEKMERESIDNCLKKLRQASTGREAASVSAAGESARSRIMA